MSETAETAALMRAIACFEPDINIKCNDDLANLFLPEDKRRKLSSELYRNAAKAAARNGLYEYIIARTAYFDNLFVDALTSRFSQIILLGAGYDTRAYRYGGLLGNSKVFEVDAPFTQNHKNDILKACGIPSDKMAYVPVDFEKDDLFARLIENGFDTSQRTLYIWEGVTMYLRPEAVDEVLLAIVRNSATSSVLSFDYVNVYITSESNIIRKDETVRFGMSASAMEDYVRGLGYQVKKNIGVEDMNRLYLTCENGDIFGNIKTTMNIIETELT